MKFTGTFHAPRFDLAAYRVKLDKHMQEVMAQAIMEWLEATVMAKVPVWSGASRATFLALARKIQYEIPIVPEVASRISQGEAESTGHLDLGETKPGRYTFSYSTTLPWLIINEYFNANEFGIEGGQRFHLRQPGPYHFQLLGQAAFHRFARHVRLPNPFSCLKSKTIKVR